MGQQKVKKIDLEKEVENIKDGIVKNYNPEKIILFGSFTNEKKQANSDVDLAIIKKTNKRFIDRLKEMARIIKSPLGVDVLVYTPKEWNELQDQGDYFVKEIINTGRVIYEG